MKEIILVVLLVAFAGLKINTAHAQIPVTDVASITARAVEFSTTLLKWKDQFDQMVDQYDQLRMTHESITGIRNIADVFDDPLLRKLLPDDLRASYRAFRNSGYEGLVRKGIEIYEDNHVYDYCANYESEESRLNCESQPAATAQAHGDSEEALSVIISRSVQIEQLQSQINTTEDTKAISDIQARIAIEQTTMQNESLKLYTIKMLDDTQQRLNDDRQHQINQRTLNNTRGFSSDLEIPIFGNGG